MKILFFAWNFYPKALGGMEKFLYNVIIRLRSKHSITLLTPNFNNISIKDVKIKLINVPKVTIPFIKTIFGIISVWIILPFYLIKNKIELVSVFNTSLIGTNVLLISKLFKIPNCINLMGVFDQKSRLNFFENDLGFFFTKNLIVISRDLVTRFRKITYLPKNYIKSKKTFYIPAGINFKYWETKSKKFINQKKIYDLVMVGNMTNPKRWIQKGFVYLVQSLKLIEKKKKIQFKTLVIGNIDFKGTEKILRGIDKNQFDFAGGNFKLEDLIKKILSAKIFVMPSTSEGMPNSLMEAMALGMPCIATNVGGIPDLISNNFNGILVKSKNEKDLADKLFELYNNPSIHSKLGKNAQEKIKKKFGWNKIIKKIELCYAKLK